MAETDVDYTPLDEVDCWVFDLDNTLYPAECRLFDQVSRRMGEWVAAYFGVERDDATKLQKDYFHAHGSTLRGLMERHGIEPGAYLDYVHNIDLSLVAPSPSLDRALARLPGRKLIFTNATVAHADRVMKRLGVDHHFEDIFDIIAADYVPKPAPEVYTQLVERHGIDPERSVLFEDSARNLAPAADIGMKTVWVRTGHAFSEWGSEGDHIQFVADDLETWLADYLGR